MGGAAASVRRQPGDRMTRHRLRLLPMAPPDIDEEHRASTPLELLFDLCVVVAVSQAAEQLNDTL
jgi:hypothetical protein